MEYRRLGRTEFAVSAIGLGGGQYTGEFNVNPKDADALLDYAMESEINLFDTAQMYNYGEGEELLGRAAYRHPDKKVYLSTKIGYMDMTLSRYKGEHAYTDPVEIRRCIKHSLWLLRRDALDICQIHEADWPKWEIDYESGDSVILNTLEELKKEGVIRNIGLGTWKLETAIKLIQTGRIDMVLSAGGMDILSAPMEKELIPIAKKYDVGIVLGSCFGANSRYLTDKNKDKLTPLFTSDDPIKRNTAHKFELLYDLADELGVDMFELSIRYLLSVDGVQCLMLGAREKRHVQANLRYANKGIFSADINKRIRQIQTQFPSLTPHQIKHLDGGAAPVLNLLK